MVTWVGKSFGGCDSTVHTLIWITKPDDAISASNDTLFAAPGADTYRWMKCSNQTLIAGATSAWYSPALDGDYAVVVSLGNCKDTSQCITIMHMGLEAWAKNSVQVVPNPSSGEAYLVSTPGQPVPEKWRVYDRSGRLIQEGHVNSKSNRLPLLPTGIYLLECEMPSGQRQSITWICQ
jgi:hypothetical protein